jgi:hypothetical protein
VITKDAKSAPGVFTVHRINDQVLFDIPKGELGKEAPSVEPIAATFPVEAEGKDGAVVVDVTRFFKQCRLSATAKTPDAPPLVPE